MPFKLPTPRPVFLGTLLLRMIAVLAQSRVCYFPDGTNMASTHPNQFLPCSEVSDGQCCRVGDACISNGLCFGALEGKVRRPRDPATIIHFLEYGLKYY